MKFIKKKSVAQIPEIKGSIVDTTNVEDKIQNTYSARIIDEKTGIETITSGNTSAIKFPDGTMICRGRISYPEATFTQLGGVYYRQLAGVTFPEPFIDIPNPSVVMNMGNVGSITTGAGVTSTAIGGFNVMSANAQARSITVFWTAIGRWK